MTVRIGETWNVMSSPQTVWMDCGRYEWLMESNRRTHRLLAEHGYAATYHEYAAGHNYTAWRDDLARGIAALFGTR